MTRGHKAAVDGPGEDGGPPYMDSDRQCVCGKKKPPEAAHCCRNCVQRCCCGRTKEATAHTCATCADTGEHPCPSCKACLPGDKQVCGRRCALACGDESDDDCVCEPSTRGAAREPFN